MVGLKLTAARWRQETSEGTVVRRRGDLFDVDEAQAVWLVKSGAAVDPAVEQDAPAPAPEPDEQDAPAPAPEPSDGLPERPLNAANKAAWEDYYRAVKGQDPKGLDKAQIMAEVG